MPEERLKRPAGGALKSALGHATSAVELTTSASVLGFAVRLPLGGG